VSQPNSETEISYCSTALFPHQASSNEAQDGEMAQLYSHLRKSEVAKLKAEARLDLLRTINSKDYLKRY